MFSCLNDGLYLIKGFVSFECIILKITSNGIFTVKFGLITALINLIPFLI